MYLYTGDLFSGLRDSRKEFEALVRKVSRSKIKGMVVQLPADDTDSARYGGEREATKPAVSHSL